MKPGARFTGIIGCVVVLLIVLSISACEKNEWAKAQQANTVEAYKSFLAKYPKGKFASEANAAIEKIEWQKVKQANTIEAYEGFLTSYPNSEKASTAKERIVILKEQELIAIEKEAIDNLTAIQTALANYAAKQKAARKKVLYIACKPSPPNGGTDAIPDSWVDSGGFNELDFKPSQPIFYRYEVAVNKAGNSYTATATGDLDEDGTTVTFTITSDNPTPVKSIKGKY